MTLVMNEPPKRDIDGPSKLTRLIEVSVFIALAVGLHLAIAMRLPADDEGSDAGGQGGDALVSLKGAAPGTVAMVKAWETPPDVQTETKPSEMQPQETPEQPPVQPKLMETPAPTMPKMELAPQATDAVALPNVDTETPPPPEPEPVSTTAPVEAVRPMERPQDIQKPEPAPKKVEPGPRTQEARKGGNGGATQRAAGTGGSAQAGNNHGSTRAGNGHAVARAQAVWGAKIRMRIERRKQFPHSMRGKSGTVIVRITVSREGQVLGCKVARSSGQQAFDEAAINAVQRAGRMPHAPDELTDASYSFNLPMNFS